MGLALVKVGGENGRVYFNLIHTLPANGVPVSHKQTIFGVNGLA
jgi:hypothetical protein